MPVDPQRVQAVFAAVFEITDPDQRRALLDRECGSDEELRRRVEALLRAHDQSDPLLDNPLLANSPIDPKLTATGAYVPSEKPGVVIAGRYKLLEEIGEGGMGTVWVAEQSEPVRRKVALKLIKAGMDTRSVLARFEAERQALALMDHPNIAKVLDGGLTESGRPFFIMEYVKGVPITEYCDAVRLSIDERLQLFTQVCSAVQHAHQKGIIHRDLKPSNILVAPYDDRAVPKVIDFGLAKAMHQSLTEKTLHTGHGAALGTPLYMSPEQAQLNNIDIDTRADVYSLGVLLYELLTGTTPLERKRFKEAAWDEVRRIIREEEPPRPSMRLSSTDTLPSLAACRHAEPAQLTKQIRGDLDWIVMKALEKDRTRRYETANGFAADVQRYLSGEPVTAHPPSTGYRLKKFVRKHRAKVLASSLLLGALLAGIAGTTWGLVHAEQQRRLAIQSQQNEAAERRKAEQQQHRAEEGERLAEERLEQIEAEKQRAIEFRDIALNALRATTGDDVEKLIAGREEISPNERAYLEAVIERWQTFSHVGGNDEQSRAMRAEGHFRVGLLWQKLGRRDEALKKYEVALPIRENLVAEFPNVPEYRFDLARSHTNLGALLQGLGKLTEAEEHYLAAKTIFEKLVAEFPNVPEYRLDLAIRHMNLGTLLRDLGKPTEAEEHYLAAKAIHEQLVAEFPNVPEYRSNLALSHNNLGALLQGLGKLTEAEEHYLAAITIQEQLVAEFPNVQRYRFDLASSHTNLGGRLQSLGRHTEAEEHCLAAKTIQENLVAEFPNVPEYRSDLAFSHYNWGALLQGLGSPHQTEEHYLAAKTIQEKLVAEFPNVPKYRSDLAFSHYNLGSLLSGLNRLTEAEVHHLAAMTIREKLVAEFPNVPEYRSALAHCHYGLGSLLSMNSRTEAEEHYLAAIAIQEKLVAEVPNVQRYRFDLASSHTNLGGLLQSLGKLTEAEEHCLAAKTIQEKLVAEVPNGPEYRSALATSHNYLGSLLSGLNRRTEAEEHYFAAIMILEKLVAEFPNVPEYKVYLGGSCCNLGIIVRDSGSADESLEWFDKAIATLSSVYLQEPRHATAKQFLRNSHWGRAIALDLLERHADAIPDWDKAVELSPVQEQPGLRLHRVMSCINAGLYVEAISDVEELTKLSLSSLSSDNLYNFACVYAVFSEQVPAKQAEYADRAMELLHQAVEAGWSDAAHLKQDTDLDTLRDREDFKSLLAKLEGSEP